VVLRPRLRSDVWGCHRRCKREMGGGGVHENVSHGTWVANGSAQRARMKGWKVERVGEERVENKRWGTKG